MRRNVSLPARSVRAPPAEAFPLRGQAAPSRRAQWQTAPRSGAVCGPISSGDTPFAPRAMANGPAVGRCLQADLIRRHPLRGQAAPFAPRAMANGPAVGRCLQADLVRQYPLRGQAAPFPAARNGKWPRGRALFAGRSHPATPPSRVSRPFAPRAMANGPAVGRCFQADLIRRHPFRGQAAPFAPRAMANGPAVGRCLQADLVRRHPLRGQAAPFAPRAMANGPRSGAVCEPISSGNTLFAGKPPLRAAREAFLARRAEIALPVALFPPRGKRLRRSGAEKRLLHRAQIACPRRQPGLKRKPSRPKPVARRARTAAALRAARTRGGRFLQIFPDAKAEPPSHCGKAALFSTRFSRRFSGALRL